MVSDAERPILLVGGECRTAEFRENLVALSEHWNVPVAVTTKMQDQYPNDRRRWIGTLASSCRQLKSGSLSERI
nr:hypothetical protein [Bradyrhizobium sp. 157]